MSQGHKNSTPDHKDQKKDHFKHTHINYRKFL